METFIWNEVELVPLEAQPSGTNVLPSIQEKSPAPAPAAPELWSQLALVTESPPPPGATGRRVSLDASRSREANVRPRLTLSGREHKDFNNPMGSTSVPARQSASGATRDASLRHIASDRGAQLFSSFTSGSSALLPPRPRHAHHHASINLAPWASGRPLPSLSREAAAAIVANGQVVPGPMRTTMDGSTNAAGMRSGSVALDRAPPPRQTIDGAAHFRSNTLNGDWSDRLVGAQIARRTLNGLPTSRSTKYT